MTVPDAAGCLSKAIDLVINSLVDSAAFRSWLNAPTADKARERVYFSDLEGPRDWEDGYSREEIDALRPFVLVYIPDGGATWIKTAGEHSFVPSITVNVMLQSAAVPADDRYDVRKIEREFTNHLGQIIGEALTNTNRSPYPAVNSASLVQTVSREHWSNWEANGDSFEAEVQFVMGEGRA